MWRFQLSFLTDIQLHKHFQLSSLDFSLSMFTDSAVIKKSLCSMIVFPLLLAQSSLFFFLEKSFVLIERHKSIPVKRTECVLLGPPDRLAKQSEVGLLGGGGSSVIVYPV